MYRTEFSESGIATAFIGRKKELDYLGRAVELSSTGRTVVVQGTPGSGKTRLAEELAARMAESGTRVLWGQWCEDDVGRLPRRFIVLGAESRYGTRGVLFSNAIISSSDLPRLGSRLQNWIRSIGSMPPRWHLPTAATGLPDAAEGECITRVKAGGRLLLIMDNLVAGDRLSLILLRTLARNLRPIPGVLLGIFDERQVFDSADFETTLGALVARTDRITLRGLADHEASQMINLVSGQRVGQEMLSEIKAIAKGNPRTLRKMADLLRAPHAPHTEENPATLLSDAVTHSSIVARFHTAHDISGNETNLLARHGDYWTVLFRGNVVRLRHVKGFTYIASLLRQPYRQLHALELAALEQRGDGVTDHHPDLHDASLSSLRLTLQRDTGPVLDWRAKEDYARRLRELDEEIREATAFNDLGRLAKCQQERAFITEEVARAIGLCGRDRKGVSAAERARVSVTHAIKSGIHKISRCQPELGRHLSIAVRTGVYCAYLPEQVVERSLPQ